MTTIQIVGGGRMGEALLAGLIAADFARPADIRVVEVVAARASELTQTYPGIEVTDSVGPATGTVLAVKPADIVAAVASVVSAGTERILSVAAGVTVAALESAADGVPVIRAMPNTPALVGVGAGAIAGGTTATEADLVWAESVLGSVGIVERVPEHLLDAVTGLSGSGPAYVFLIAEALEEAGVLNGLPRPTAKALVRQTLLGAATLLDESPHDASRLRGDVTSPGGTTAAGLRALEDRGVRAAILDAVSASAQRSRELGD